MATFENPEKQRSSSSVASGQKLDFTRIQPAVEKFIKVLHIDLDRLGRHRANIEKFQLAENWELLNKEHINASRTVKQLKATIKALDHTRWQVMPEDLEKFDSQIQEIQMQAIAAVVQFLDLHADENSDPLSGLGERKSVQRSTSQGTSEDTVPLDIGSLRLQPEEGPALRPGPDSSGERLGKSPCGEQKQVQIQATRSLEDIQAEQSWQNLKTSLVELNSLVHDFSTAVHTQQQAVDEIEENVEQAQQNVEQGTTFLEQAAKYKSAVFPVVGAMVGGAIGGPIGLLAGMKVGGLAAVGGGIAGLTGGQLLKKKQEDRINAEQQNRQAHRAVPDVVDSSNEPVLPDVTPT